MNASIIKYALDQTTGQPLFIDNVPNGLLCNCICAKCSKRMMAIQGEARKKEWHFRHQEDSDCTGGQETAIHKLAKKIIVENSRISIPGEVLSYSNARQEEFFLEIIPDVTVVVNGGAVYFEITVTHGVDNNKYSFYSTGKYRSIEIDLTGISYDITPSELEEIVLHKTNNKKKIYWDAEKQRSDASWAPLKIAAAFVGIFLFFRMLFNGNTK